MEADSPVFLCDCSEPVVKHRYHVLIWNSCSVLYDVVSTILMVNCLTYYYISSMQATTVYAFGRPQTLTYNGGSYFSSFVGGGQIPLSS